MVRTQQARTRTASHNREIEQRLQRNQARLAAINSEDGILAYDHNAEATQKVRGEYAERVERALEGFRVSDGLVAAPLKIAAETIVDQLARQLGEDESLHREAIIAYLIGVWGDVAHSFPEHIDLPGYHEWRERSRREVLGQ